MSSSRMGRLVPTLLAVAAFAASVAVAWLVLDVDSVESVSRDSGVVGLLIFYVAYVVATMAVLPSTAFNLAAGAIFGPAVGLLVATAGALSSAFVTIVARRLPGAHRFRDRVEQRWPTLSSRLADGGTSYILALRLFPIIPYGLVSYASSVSRVDRRAFALGSAIGTPIGLAPFVFLGASGQRALSGGTLVPLIASLSMLAVLVVGGAWYRRRDLTVGDGAAPRRIAPTLDTAWDELPHGEPEEPIELSVVFPSYNEAQRLPPTLLDAVTYLSERGTTFEIIVADDGSSDGTPAIVQQVAKIVPEVRLVANPKNFGKGYAVRTGIANSRGRVVVFSDSDGSTPIGELERLLEAIDNGADVAIGSRVVDGPGIVRETQAHRKFIGRVFNGIVSTLLLPGLKDTQCGFKMFTREAADAIFTRQRLDGFSFDVEILFIARRLGLTTAEVGVNWFDVAGSKVRIIRDSARMLRDTLLIVFRDLTGRYAFGGAPSNDDGKSLVSTS